ncbi:polysaccharide deacetylase family protein [Flaviaesturariibacter amylovorans]|uniref:Polysaccharide deacetylase family protein n=1 Tax=Flaviaesturariibacter amylovorans TaxID=1084520 RepID=A0ABP8HP85_9BACT
MLSPQILLSFDVEEFDLPLEYGQSIPIGEQLRVGYAGLVALEPLLQEVRATLFTTAYFASQYAPALRGLSERHEIASHTYYHTRFEESHLLASRQLLQEVSGQEVTGLRMPRMRDVRPAAVLEAGYTYNSSVNPTWIPGRYNNLRVPRRPFREEGLLEFPVSVTPKWRIPLFWLAFKNFPYAYFLRLVRHTLRQEGYVCLYFHPWEFTDIRRYQLPGYVRRDCGPALVQKLERLVKDLGKEGQFVTMAEYVRNIQY